MITLTEGKTRRNINIPCQICSNPTSYQLSFAHKENPNAKTTLHLCHSCLNELQEKIQKVLNELNEINKNVKLTEKMQRELWEQFDDYDIDENECITKQFLHFPAGTHREEIWHWFEERGPLTAYQLLYEFDD